MNPKKRIRSPCPFDLRYRSSIPKPPSSLYVTRQHKNPLHAPHTETSSITQIGNLRFASLFQSNCKRSSLNPSPSLHQNSHTDTDVTFIQSTNQLQSSCSTSSQNSEMSPVTVTAAPPEIAAPTNDRGSQYHYCTVMKNGVPLPPQDERGMNSSSFSFVSSLLSSCLLSRVLQQSPLHPCSSRKLTDMGRYHRLRVQLLHRHVDLLS